VGRERCRSGVRSCVCLRDRDIYGGRRAQESERILENLARDTALHRTRYIYVMGGSRRNVQNSISWGCNLGTRRVYIRFYE
jgi:hypothetical protein